MTSPDLTTPYPSPDESSPGVRQILRLIAILGVGAVLLQEAIIAFPLKQRQEMGFVVLVLAVPVVLLSLAWGMPSAWQKLFRHPDLLVPLGILTLAEAVVGWLMLLPLVGDLLRPTLPLRLAALSFTVSAGFVLLIVLKVLYGAWMTMLILNIVRQERDDPVRSLSASWRWFFRVLALEFIGWAVLFAGLAMALVLVPIAPILALPAIGIGALVWNLATAALLPVALDERLGFWEALTTGIQVSWATKGRWWKLVVAQMVLLGWATLLFASYSESTPQGFTRHESTNWAVNAFWTGGYENECRWYTDFMKALKTPKLEVISTVLGLVFGVLAIGVKLTVVERLWPRQSWTEERPDNLLSSEEDTQGQG